jgi:hypothetical protein
MELSNSGLLLLASSASDQADSSHAESGETLMVERSVSRNIHNFVVRTARGLTDGGIWNLM